MKTLLFILAFAVITSNAATITGTIRDSTGALRTNTAVMLKPVSGAIVLSGTNYYSPRTQTATTTANGTFSFSAIVGDYTLSFGATDSQRISVPDSTNSIDFISLLNTNGLTYVYSIPGALVRVSSGDSTFGFLSAKVVAGTYLTITTNNAGGNETLTVDLVSAPQATNAALTALASNPAMYQATNANLTSWAALAPASKQDASTNLTGWAAWPTNSLTALVWTNMIPGVITQRLSITALSVTNETL